MNKSATDVIETARAYYNSDDADRFYHAIWGGEDIHIGLYEKPDEPIADASRRTVHFMAEQLGALNADSRVIDLGAGYGGSMRYLAERFGCRCVALNLSEVENERNRQANAQRHLTELIDVVDGHFEAIDAPDATFDVAWSQDALLHSGDRAGVLAEVARVLKPGGVFVFTDPMQADHCPQGVLQPILDRIHLADLGSPDFYRRTAGRLGLTEVAFHDLSPQLPMHYHRVLEELKRRQADLGDQISPDYIERMKTGLGHWIDGGRRGFLAWGVFHFRKQ